MKSPAAEATPEPGKEEGIAYVGDELEVFALARRWKAYWSRVLAPYVQGDVLEVGAGIGASTRALCTTNARSWLCLEPDPRLARRVIDEHEARPFPVAPRVQSGTVESLSPDLLFDCVLYIDVIEHIEDDREELDEAARRLKPGGVLIVLAPAHQSLYSPFDRRIGHFRRYDRPMLTAITPRGTTVDRMFYLDCAGLMLSWLNRHVRRGGTPGRPAVLAWDRLFVPVSEWLDPLLGHRLGKTIVGVWRRDGG